MATTALKTRLKALEVASKVKDDAIDFRDRFIVGYDNGDGVLYDSVTREPIPQERIDKAKVFIHVSKDCRRD